MIDEQSKAEPSPAKPSSNDDLGPLHSVGLAIALRDMAQRLSSLEGKLDKNDTVGPPKSVFFLELCKVVFGGWPALGLLFLLLFYSPLREALNAIPEKVKMAAEIGALGVSLKSTVQVEAAKLSAGNLSETIPKLSSAAIELLLRAPRSSETLIWSLYDVYDGDSQRNSETIELPSSSEIEAISELEAQGLIELESGDRRVTGADVRKIIDQFFKTYPGREIPSTHYARMMWKPNKRFGSQDKAPELTWQLSDLGKKAVEVVLRAVSTELARIPSPKNNP